VAELLEPRDGFTALRNGLRRLAHERGHWAGYPMPIQDQQLVVEPTFPKAAELMAINAPEPEVLPPDVRERNTFWSERRRCYIVVWEEGGRICWGPGSRPHSVDLLVQTLGASSVWGIEQEASALQLLGTLLEHHRFKQYLLTGMFLETSKRSGLTYLFRKLRPTVVMKLGSARYAIGDTAARHFPDRSFGLAALCLHPIAYYYGSWAGAMTPTDDVIAHLMLMRGDEAMFWRRSNQHDIGRHEAGL
jgi:hypothetical protein